MELDLNEWLKPESLNKQGDTAVLFTDEGRVGVYKDTDGTEKPTFEIGIRIKHEGGKSEDLTWTMNKTSQRAVAARLGSDTKNWVGKEALVFVTDQMINGKLRKVVYARGPN